MRFLQLTSKDQRLWRPAVVGTIAYAALFAVYVLWTISTAESEHFSEAVLGPRLAGFSLLWILTAVNGVWLIALCLDLVPAWRSEPAVRKGQIVGVLGAIAVLALVQLTVFKIGESAETWPGEPGAAGETLLESEKDR